VKNAQKRGVERKGASRIKDLPRIEELWSLKWEEKERYPVR